MKISLRIVAILLVTIIQITLIPKLSIWQAIPNLLLIIVLAQAILLYEKEGIWWAMIGGILLDLILPLRFGVWTISLLIIFFVTSRSIKAVFTDPGPLLSILIFFFASLIYQSIISLFVWQFNLLSITTTTIFNTLIFILIYFYLLRFGPKKIEEVKLEEYGNL
jgi:rod shape-determining protein MreD